MRCPRCGYEQLCPCPPCKMEWEKKSPNHKPWIWVIPDGPIRCSNCGLTKPAGWWENLAMEVRDGI